MEYLDRAKEYKLPLDIQYYVEKKLSGIYTGFLFYLNIVDKEGLLLQRDLTDEQIERNKTLTLAAAKKYVRALIMEGYKPEENYNHLVAKRFYKNLEIRYPLLKELTKNYSMGVLTIDEISMGFSSDQKDVPVEGAKLNRSEHRALVKRLIMQKDNILIDIEQIINKARSEYEDLDEKIKDIRIASGGEIEKFVEPENFKFDINDYSNIIKFNELIEKLNNIFKEINSSQALLEL